MMELDDYLRRTYRQGDCLIWSGCCATDGYPRRAPNIKVHREVFYLTHGFYPEVVRHLCDNPKCINPLHLLAGTQADNISDRTKRGRTHNHVDSDLITEVIALRKRGLTYKQIAAVTGRTAKSAEYICLEKVKGQL